jgi:phage shock protein A
VKSHARLEEKRIAATAQSSAENRVKLRSLMTSDRVDEALTRFDQLERRVDSAEGRADSLSIADGTGKPGLADEIAALEGSDKIDEELEEMKRALGKGDDDEKKGN